MSFRYHHGDRPLEGYTILRGIGRGGFGEVYYAVSDGGREVALKAIQQNHDVEIRGVQHCMNLKNPHLVSIFDVKNGAGGMPFVIMEYVAGPSLRDILRESKAGLGVEKAAFLVREIGKALSYIHERGIVHRDLKPENIFYEDGYVKVGDYGLSKYISVSRQSGQTISVGTVHYMAPEIGSGNYHHGIDIYALGVILYELLTGNVPFNGDSMGEILMKHLTCEPDLSPVPEDLRPVLQKALAKSPKERFSSVRAMVDALMSAGDIAARVGGFNPTTLSTCNVRSGDLAPSAAPAAVRAARTEPATPQPLKAPEASPPAPPRAPAPSPAGRITWKDVRQRIVQGIATTVAMALAMGLFAGTGFEDVPKFFVLILSSAAALFFAECWIMPRLELEPGMGRRLATFGIAGGILLAAAGILEFDRKIIPVLMAGVALLDWHARTNFARRERVSFSLALNAGIVGLLAAAVTDAEILVGAGALAATSMILGAVAPMEPRAGAEGRIKVKSRIEGAGLAERPRAAAAPPPVAAFASPPLAAQVSPYTPTMAHPAGGLPAAAALGAAGGREALGREPNVAAPPPSRASRLFRPRDDRMLAGVCSGIARAYGWDLVWVRVAFLILALCSGVGLVLYLCLWLCMPGEELPGASSGESRLLRVLLSLPLVVVTMATLGLALKSLEDPPPIFRDRDLSRVVAVAGFSVAAIGSLLAFILSFRKPRRSSGSGWRPRSSWQASSPGWSALGTLFLVFSAVEVAIGVALSSGLGEPILREVHLESAPWLRDFGRQGEHVVVALFFFLPGVFCLLFARRDGGPSHVLRGAAGWAAAGVLGGLIGMGVPEAIRLMQLQPGQRLNLQWSAVIALLLLGCLSAVCLAWPKKDAPQSEDSLPSVERREVA